MEDMIEMGDAYTSPEDIEAIKDFEPDYHCIITCKDGIFSSDHRDADRRINIEIYNINPDTKCVQFTSVSGIHYQLPLYNVYCISNKKIKDS